jgi:type I restriction enzyme S subunit
VDVADISAEYLFQFLRSEIFKKYIDGEVIQTGQPHLNLGILRETRVPLPKIAEQRRIAEILQTWDEAIEKLEALRVAGERQYSGLADDLIFGRRRNIGKRRNWRHRRLGDVTREVTARNVGGRLGRDAVMGVTKANGIVPMREQTIGADLSRYKVLPPLGFAYNPMRINIGSIALSRLESDVLVSPDYVLFVCEKDKLSPDYLEHLRKTHFWSHHINAGGAGSVRLRIYYDDFAALNLPLPDYDEQLAIVEVLDAARRQIDLTEAEIDLLALQKRGLMQKLLTGEWRVKLEER